jgi:hypothetical protein
MVKGINQQARTEDKQKPLQRANLAISPVNEPYKSASFLDFPPQHASQRVLWWLWVCDYQTHTPTINFKQKIFRNSVNIVSIETPILPLWGDNDETKEVDYHVSFSRSGTGQ